MRSIQESLDVYAQACRIMGREGQVGWTDAQRTVQCWAWDEDYVRRVV